jgi:hypothetical protein
MSNESVESLALMLSLMLILNTVNANVNPTLQIEIWRKN